MKFGQLIEHNTSGIFLKNQAQNAMEILFPDPFLKNQNWEYLWINSLKFYRACFFCMAGWGISKYTEDHLLLPTIKLSYKTKWGLKLVSLPYFLHDFWRKKFLLPYSITWSNFNVWLPLFGEIIGNIGTCLLTRLWRHKFWN